MTMPNSSSEDEVTMAAPTAVALKATRVCRQKLSSCYDRHGFLCSKHCRHFGSRAQNGRGSAMGLRGSHFSTCACHQNIGWAHRHDDLSRGPILDHARRKPAHERASNAFAVKNTAKRDFSKKEKSTLTSRALAVHLWSWRRGRNSTISGFLRSFWMFAMCSVASSKEMTGAVESWT